MFKKTKIINKKGGALFLGALFLSKILNLNVLYLRYKKTKLFNEINSILIIQTNFQ